MTAGGGCVFLLTDYGYRDEFAGLLRAAVARRAPGAPVVDLTHGIEPFDVAGGARALERCAGHLGPGVVVGVVDPGVGTARRSVAVEVPVGGGPRVLVGPDNGLLLPAADTLGGPRRAVVLPPSSGATTFDGRDVFAPAAARLWAGAALADVGEPVPPDELVRLPPPRRVVDGAALAAEVVWVDRYGNVQLAADAADANAAGLGSALVVQLGDGAEHPARRVRAFAEAGALGVVVDGSGRLALVYDRRPAAAALGLGVGDTVVLRAVGRPGMGPAAGGADAPAGPEGAGPPEGAGR